MLRESEFAKRDETNEAGSDVYEQNENVSKKLRIICFEKEDLSISSSEDDYLGDFDSTNSTEIPSMEADDIRQARQCISGSSIGFASIMDADRLGQDPHLVPEIDVNYLAHNVAKAAYVQHDGWGSTLQSYSESLFMAEAYGNCSETSTKVPLESSEDSSPFTRAPSDSENADRYKQSNQVPSSQKKRKVQTTSDSKGCKRCNCKMSNCLQLYCDCFASGTYCLGSCACEGCYNKYKYADKVRDARQKIESRKPLAFASKVVKLGSDSPANMEATSSSARHRKGCNCRKSRCRQKYCECLQMGVGCSDACRCEGCQNSFGTKEEMRYKKTEMEDGQSEEQLGTAHVDRTTYLLGNHYFSHESVNAHQEWNSNKCGMRTDIISSPWQQNADYGHCTTPFSESYPGIHQKGNNYFQSSPGSLGWSNSSISSRIQPRDLRTRNDIIFESLNDTSNVTNAVEDCLPYKYRASPARAVHPSPVFENRRTYYPSPSSPPIYPLTPVSNTTEGDDNLYRSHPNDRHWNIPEKRDSS